MLEKLHLQKKSCSLSGAIRSAGTVKSRKSGKYATSDWMEMEKQRGISILSHEAGDAMDLEAIKQGKLTPLWQCYLDFWYSCIHGTLS